MPQGILIEEKREERSGKKKEKGFYLLHMPQPRTGAFISDVFLVFLKFVLASWCLTVYNQLF